MSIKHTHDTLAYWVCLYRNDIKDRYIYCTSIGTYCLGGHRLYLNHCLFNELQIMTTT